MRSIKQQLEQVSTFQAMAWLNEQLGKLSTYHQDKFGDDLDTQALVKHMHAKGINDPQVGYRDFMFEKAITKGREVSNATVARKRAVTEPMGSRIPEPRAGASLTEIWNQEKQRMGSR